MGRIFADTRRIAQLAEETGLANAQRWLTRERAWVNDQHLAACRIPAPTFFEAKRAAWLRTQLQDLGWNAKLDRAGNVIASFGDTERHQPIILSAHIDTVFAPSRPEEIRFAADGRLMGPGVSDNGSGLAALLALARLFSETSELHELASSLLLVANVGEEGEGNLTGMRYVCRQLQTRGIVAFIVLDGPATDHITSQALASRRFEISFAGPGGHSWNDHGVPNPVHAISEMVSSFLRAADNQLTGERKRRTSYNFGVLEGGSSINSIPAYARGKLDLRSEAADVLDELSELLNSAVEKALDRENRSTRTARITAKIKDLGSRPGGKLPEPSLLLETAQAVDAFLHVHSRLDCASTDANVPLSLGLPAISIGAGGQGGGAHTADEWYRPEGRELGLWRILLIIAALERQQIRRERNTTSA